MQICWMVLANEYAKFATKKWYVTDSESKGAYSHENTINFATKSIESSLCDYSDAYILVTGNIVVTKRNAVDTADIELGAITQVAIVHCLKNVRQKLMVLLLMKQILLILQCLCII